MTTTGMISGQCIPDPTLVCGQRCQTQSNDNETMNEGQNFTFIGCESFVLYGCQKKK
jgi:hypothetical protein